MSRCPCLKVIEDRLKAENGGWAWVSQGSVDFRYEADLARPVKVNKWRKDSEMRTRCHKSGSISAKFCCLCGERLPT